MATEQRPHDGPFNREVLVIGAGLAGLCAAIKLRDAGITDFTVLERADGVGGTWRDNVYPGVAVDVNSFLYSFSFEQNPGWSRTFAPGAELQAYAERLADKYDLRRNMRFGADVTRAAFDDESHRWTVALASGDVITSRFLILATGLMSQPKWPEIEGLMDFQGTVLHSAAWDPAHELTGQRVAVIGTGASAVQVVPSVAPLVDKLHVFQRTPAWVLPKPDVPIPAVARTALRAFPPARRLLRAVAGFAPDLFLQLAIYHDRQAPALMSALERLARSHVRRQVRDADTREKLTPAYAFGCKRPGFSNDYLPTFNRSNVELITDGITRVTRRGIRTQDGRLRTVDTIILATGFKIFERGGLPPFDLVSPEGRDLRTFWDEERHQTSNGSTVPGFPNLFLLAGPYGLYSQSYLGMVEANVKVAVDCISEARARSASRVEIRPDVHAQQFEDTLRRMRSTAFFNRDCSASNSYYFDQRGDAPMVRPLSHLEMWWRSRGTRAHDYEYAGSVGEARRPASDDGVAFDATDTYPT